MKKKLTDNDCELLRLHEIDIELGGDIAERFSGQHRKDDESLEAQAERGLIWTGLNAFGLALGVKAGKAARERFIATMNLGSERKRFGKDCEHFLRSVLLILTLDGPPRPAPKVPSELSALDAGGIESLARAWLVMRHGPFIGALKAFGERWTDDKEGRGSNHVFDRPLHVQNTFIFHEKASLRSGRNQNMALAERLAQKNLLKLPSKSRPGMRSYDIERDKSAAKREEISDRFRKRIKRLTERIEKLRAKFDVEDNLLKDWNVESDETYQEEPQVVQAPPEPPVIIQKPRFNPDWWHGITLYCLRCRVKVVLEPGDFGDQEHWISNANPRRVTFRCLKCDKPLSRDMDKGPSAFREAIMSVWPDARKDRGNSQKESD